MGAWVNSTLVYCIISIFVILGYSEATSMKPLPGILKTGYINYHAQSPPVPACGD